MIHVIPDLRKLCPELECVTLKGEIINSRSTELTSFIAELAKNEAYYTIDISEIQDTRQSYKNCGKEPSRYRPSAESLRRRIRSGKGLYSISAAVDIINIVSITSGISIGGYDFSAIQGGITMKPGKTEPYDAIGRGNLNIEFLPCLYDDIGPFGSPTSDSVRTMITERTTQLLLVFFNFKNFASLEKSKIQAEQLLKKYCNLKSYKEKDY